MQLSDQERTAIAREAAMRHYRRQHPGAHDEAAWQYAARYWRKFLDVAQDVEELFALVDAMSPRRRTIEERGVLAPDRSPSPLNHLDQMRESDQAVHRSRRRVVRPVQNRECDVTERWYNTDDEPEDVAHGNSPKQAAASGCFRRSPLLTANGGGCYRPRQVPPKVLPGCFI